MFANRPAQYPILIFKEKFIINVDEFLIKRCSDIDWAIERINDGGLSCFSVGFYHKILRFANESSPDNPIYELVLDVSIAEGNYGSVKFACVIEKDEKGIWQRGEVRIIKEIRDKNNDQAQLMQAVSKEQGFTGRMYCLFGAVPPHENELKKLIAYLDMPFGGVDLNSFLQENERNLSLSARLLIVKNVMIALEVLHKKRMVHRDIKPENIVIDPVTFKVSIIDFGMSKDANEPYKNGTYNGTPTFVAPDIDMSSPKEDEKIDIYAFATVFGMIMDGKQNLIEFLKYQAHHSLIKKSPRDPLIRKAKREFDSIMPQPQSQSEEVLKMRLINLMKMIDDVYDKRPDLIDLYIELCEIEEEYFASDPDYRVKIEDLKLAATMNQVGVIAYLLEKGVCINTLSQGESALHCAVDTDAYEAVKYLLEHGADVNAEDLNLQIPIEITSNEKIQKMLEQYVENYVSSTQQMQWSKKF